jgi:hypothetical protein
MGKRGKEGMQGEDVGRKRKTEVNSGRGERGDSKDW